MLERIVFNKKDFIVEAISIQIPVRKILLLFFLNDIYESAANSTQTDVILKRCSIQFHKKLLMKLYKIGISGNLWKWFDCYLSNQVQCAKVNQRFSDMVPVLLGVPWGSILGPLLFLVFINNLPIVIKFSYLLMIASVTERPVAQMTLQSYRRTWMPFFLEPLHFGEPKCFFIELPPKIINFLLTWRHSTCSYISS